MKKQVCYFLFIVLLFSSCKEEEFEPIIEEELSSNNDCQFEPYIANELRSYIDDFFAEGEKRGVSLSREKLEAVIVGKLSLYDNACGMGFSNFNAQKTQRIEILNTDYCWNSRSDIEKENVMFHELGHAMLKRNHTTGNTTFPNGRSKSIMCGDCSAYTHYYDNEILREYYLDELFDKNTLTPSFAQRTNVVRTVFEEQFETGFMDWTEYTDGDSSLLELTIDSSENKFTTAPYALKIDVKPSINSEYSYLLKSFELDNFEDCSSLVLKTDVLTEDEFDGYLSMSLGLRERLPDGSLNSIHFARHRQEFNNPINLFKIFKFEMYCVPTRTDVVTVAFTIRSNSPTKINIDNIKVELVE